ncbi:class I SAM-dependent methyltransferase [Ornithinimicrobium cryptoxanthini]|uniref:Class I SAM-dependent methyltransferase n=1 Tax=Ornithinimicrobium cryptoxanthini TaxID=2934161 RepID=A0ABY4YHK0_9MICO|nr:class I SAM-dependent methyltransferase [Ornithinimicrobium cryptoxanthini]USQ76222.1 class I SAM-dependent methyltransferase [Ornithinimicrobium cryptoxanthini]
MDAADYYTGIVAEGYALLKGTHFPADRYADLIAASGEPALELGCGDGDPLLELRRRGLEVEGVDSSADMLARCAQRAAAAGLEVVTHHQRMEDLDLDRRFATIFLAGPTFTLLPDDDLARRALAAIREHLTDRGVAEIPLWVPPPRDDLGASRRVQTQDGTMVAFTALSEEYDVTHRTRTTHVRYERWARQPSETVEVAERDWVIHWHTQESFGVLAQEAGLQVVAMTDLDGTAVTGDEEQFVVTLTR